MFSPRLSIKPQINNNNNKKKIYKKKVHQLKANQPATQEKNLRKWPG